MPLQDHFHPPLSVGRHWEGFHGRWAAALADSLNGDRLPPRYFAEMQVHFGSRIEIDVATFADQANGPAPRVAVSSSSSVATAAPAPVWVPPAPAFTMPAAFPDEVEVRVYDSEGGPTLVAAVELVSPGNKDRPEHRRAFAAKCAAYLQTRVGLVVVDIVTSRQFNLHDELVRLTGQPDTFVFPDAAHLYAVAYRPARREAGDRIDVWPAPLAVGQSLPALPLHLRGFGEIPLDLEASYAEACQRSRLP